MSNGHPQSAAYRAALLLALLPLSSSWPEVSGSCNGPASGEHHAEVGGFGVAGGYSIKFSPKDSTGADALRAARISVDLKPGSLGTGFFTGFLIKALDASTGDSLPAFATSAMPPAAGLFDGCTDRESAVSHIAEAGFSAADLVFDVTWPAGKEVVIQAFLLEEEEIWFEAYGSSSSSLSRPAIKLDCPRARLSPAAVAVGLCPIPILVACAALLMLPSLRSLRKKLHVTRPFGSSTVAPKLPHPLAQAATFDVIPTVREASLGQCLAFAFYFACQAVSFGLSIAFFSAGSRSMQGYLLSPWDVPFGRATGHLLQIGFSNTLWFATRHSAIGSISGISHERMLRFHRIIGRFTFLVVVAHGAAHVVYWQVKGCFESQPTCYGLGNVYGSVSGLLMLIAGVLTFDPIRRWSYELFLWSHMLIFAVIALACVHATDTFFFLIPPLLFLFLDLANRNLQWLRSVKVESCTVLPHGGLLLQLNCPTIAQALFDKKGGALGSFIAIRCFAISPDYLSFHPFTISGLIMDETGQATGITVHQKSMGKNSWTCKLRQLVEAGTTPSISIEGPYGCLSIDIQEYSTVVCVAGGIGFTPFAHLLQMWLYRREECLSSLTNLVVVWSSRNPSEFDWFAKLFADAGKHTSDGTTLSITLANTNSGVSRDSEMQILAGACQATAMWEQTGVISNVSGRPDIDAIISKAATAGGACVLACGPLSMIESAQSSCFRHTLPFHAETFIM